jgi:hypothetical protein
MTFVHVELHKNGELGVTDMKLHGWSYSAWSFTGGRKNVERREI